ncbi:MAG TPA: hypothetical protein VK761_04095, partial [Solirubrobacteraceae bacterium]|nr:hypothetical protein [Solirubrobacteraceae bacterium]
LARQQQFGELGGADAGTPAQVAFLQTEVVLDGWSPAGGGVLPYAPQSDVVEALVAGEAAGPAHSTLDRVQAGRALAAALPAAVAAQLRSAFALTLEPDSPRLLARAAAAFADGLAVAAAFAGAAAGNDAVLGAALKLAPVDAAAARADLAAFAGWCAITFGTGPGSWVPERLERRFALAADGQPVLNAPGHARERVDWHDFDFVAAMPSTSTTPTPTSTMTTATTTPIMTGPRTAAAAVARTRVPTAIQFPGQPRDRFWEFEDATLSLARIDATTSDLGRLALVEFSTLYGNDWFGFPIPITYGSLQYIAQLVVRDSFGTHELIAPAADPYWALYRPTGAAPASPLLVVPAVTSSPLAGDVVEEVDFVRDDMAALVWAVEQVVTDADGTRRDLADEYLRAAVRASASTTGAGLAYRLMTDVPPNWVPFIPVRLPGSTRQVGLVEAVVPRSDGSGDPVAAAPLSSVLQELKGLVLPEEEVPAAGVIVRRRWFLARSADGGRHAWAARSAASGRGEGSSGLRFDVARAIPG